MCRDTPASNLSSSSSSGSKEPRPPEWKVWFVASRPHTLTASISPVVVGCCATYYKIISGGASDQEKASFWMLTAQWVIFCVLIQLGTNLHNDYADFVKGADTEKRVGQARATQKGWLTATQTATAATFVLGLALCFGITLILSIHGTSAKKAIMVFIVVSAVFNAFAYTGGPYPLGYIGLDNFSIGYSGLGDIFVFLYFGLVATLTLPYLYICCTPTANDDLEQLLLSLVPYAIQVACLATNIIVVNNLRDRHTDVLANKRTVAVRFGATFCRVEYLSMMVTAYMLVCWDMYIHEFATIRLLPMLSFPLAWKELQAINTKGGSALNPHVGGTAKVQFLFSILLCVAIRVSQ